MASDWVQGVENMFLEIERDHASLSIGMFAVCDGPAPTVAEFTDHVEAHLGQLNRWRQRPSPAPLSVLPSVWADDDSFRSDNHIRQSAIRCGSFTCSRGSPVAASCTCRSATTR